ncbi:hypothetical protein FA254_11595 [Pseudomonas aeruginosa]|nr:hypothetical protein [Pseudomonas aeruginosa]
MTESKICTCPSGDGSLRHPCPAHPAVEQAGGDERAAFELFVRKHCGMPAHIAVNWDAKFTNDAWEGWQARAALAKPSPAQAEAERPVVVARLYRSNDLTMTPFAEVQKPLPLPASDGTLTVDALMTVAQHERIVGELRSDRDSWAEQAEQRLADWDEMRKERDAALARVAELEGQSGFEFVYDSDELVAVPRGLLGAACHAIDKKRDAPRTIAKLREYARGLPAPVAQAQQLNDLDKQCRDDVARALGLRPNQERGFAWSYLLASIKSCVKASGDSAQAQHSVPGDIMRDAQRYRWLRDQQFYFSFSTENSDAGISSCTAGMSSRFKNLSWVDAAIDSAIAAAPGKEGV